MSRIFRELNKTQPGGPPPPRRPEQPSNPDSAQGNAPDIAALRAELETKQLDFNQRAEKLHARESQLDDRISAIERRTDELFNKSESDAQAKQADILKRLSQTQAHASRAQKENAELQIRVNQFESKSSAELKRDHNRVQAAEEALEATQRSLREYTQEIASILTALRDQDAQRQALVAQMQTTAEQVAREQHEAGVSLAAAEQTHAAEQETVAQQRKEIESLTAQTDALNKHIARLESEQKTHAETNEQRREALQAKLAESQSAHASAEKALAAEKDQRQNETEVHKKRISELNVKILDLDKSLNSSQSEFKRVTEALEKETKQSEQLTSSMKANETRLRSEMETLQAEVLASEKALQAQESAFTSELDASGDALLSTIDSIFNNVNTEDSSSTPKHVSAEPLQPAKQSADAMVELNAKISNIHEVSDATRKALQRSQDARQTLHKEAQILEQNLRDKLETANQAAASAETEKKALAKALEEQRQNEKTVTARLSEEKAALSQRVDGLTSDIDQRQNETGAHKNQISELNANIAKLDKSLKSSQSEFRRVTEALEKEAKENEQMTSSMHANETRLRSEMETLRAEVLASEKALQAQETAFTRELDASGDALLNTIDSIFSNINTADASTSPKYVSAEPSQPAKQSADAMDELDAKIADIHVISDATRKALQRSQDVRQTLHKEAQGLEQTLRDKLETANQAAASAEAEKQTLAKTLEDQRQNEKSVTARLSEEKMALSQRLDGLTKEIEQRQSTIAMLEHDHSALQSEAQASQATSTASASELESQIGKERALRQGLQSRLAELTEALHALQHESKAAGVSTRTSVEALETKLEAATSTSAGHAQTVASLQEEIHAAEANQEQHSIALQRMRDEHQAAQQQIERSKEELDAAKTNQEQQTAALQSMRNEHQAAQKRIKGLKEELGQAHAALSGAQAQSTSLQTGLQTDLEKARATASAAETQRQAIAASLDALATSHAKDKADEKSRIDTLEKQLERGQSAQREFTARIVELEKQTTDHRHLHQKAADAYRTDIAAVTRQLEEAQRQHTLVAAEHEKALARIRELESKIGSLREKNAHASNALQASLADLTAEQRTQHTTLSDRIQTLEGEANRARTTLDTAHSELEILTKLRVTLETDIQTSREAAAASLNERQQLQGRIQEITKEHAQQKAALEANIAGVESKLKEATAFNDAKTEQAKAREAETAKERETATDRIDETGKQLEDEKTRSRQQLQQSEKARNALQSELEDARQAAKASLAEVDQLKATLTELKRDQASQQHKLRETTSALDSRIHDVSTTGDNHLKRIETLEDALRQQKAEQEALQQKLDVAEKARQSAVEDAKKVRATLEADLAKEREAHKTDRTERDQKIVTLKDQIERQQTLSERSTEQSSKTEKETRSKQVEANERLKKAEAKLQALHDELLTLENTHSDSRREGSKQTDELDQRILKAESAREELHERVHELEQSLAETDRQHSAVTDEQKALQTKLIEVEAARQASLAEAKKSRAALSEALEKERNDHSRNRDDHSKQIKSLKTQIQELQRASGGATKQWKETVKETRAEQNEVAKRLEETKRAHDALEKELAHTRGGQSASQNELEALQNELKSLESMHSEGLNARVKDTQNLEQRIQKTEAARQELQTRVQQMESALAETRRDHAAVTEEHKNAIARNHELEQEIAALRAQGREATGDVQKALADITASQRNEQTALSKRVAALESDAERAQATITSARADMDALTGQRKALQSDIQAAQNAIHAALQERDQLQGRIQSLTDAHAQQTATLKADVARVQAELDRASAANTAKTQQLQTLEADVLRERKATAARSADLETTRTDLTEKTEAAEIVRDDALGDLALARAKLTQLETASQQSRQENATLVKSAAKSAAKLEEARKLLEGAKNRNRQQLQQADKGRAALQAELKEARNASKRSLSELDELKSTLSELKQDQDSTRHKLHEKTTALDSRIHDVSTSGDAHVKRIENLEHALRDQQKQQTRLQKKLDASEADRQAAVDDTHKLRKTLSAEFDKERKRHESDSADRDKRIETLTIEIEQLQDASDTAAAHWKKTEQETRDQQEEANKRLNEAERARAALEKELARTRGSQSASQNALQTLRLELEALEATQSEGWQDRTQHANDLDARIHKTEASRQELQNQVQQLEKSLAAQKQRESELAGVVSDIEEQYRQAANASASDASLTFETLLAAQHVLKRDFDDTQRAHGTMRDAMAERLAQSEKTVDTLRTHVKEHTLFSTSEFAELESVLKELQTLRETIAQQGSHAKRASEETDDALRDAHKRIAELEAQLQSEIAKATKEREAADQTATRTHAHLTEADAALSRLAEEYELVLKRVTTLTQTPALDVDPLQHVTIETDRLRAHVVALLEEHTLTAEQLRKLQKENAATLGAQRDSQEQHSHVERLQSEIEQSQKEVKRDTVRRDTMIERLRLQISEMSEEADQSTQLLEGARQELKKQKETYDLSLGEHISRTEHDATVKQLTGELSKPTQKAHARYTESESRISELSEHIETMTSKLAERDARQATADKSLESLKQANAELRKSNDALKAAVSSSDTLPPAASTQWFLKLDDDREFGPVDTATLCAWATDSRIGPDHQVSSDGKTWQAASAIDELHMDWLVELADGSPFGPVNVHTVQQLIQDGDIAPTSQAVYKLTQSNFIASDVAHPELGRVIEAREQLKSENDKLATALRDAESRIKELERRPAPMAIPPKQIKLPPKMVRASRAK